MLRLGRGFSLLRGWGLLDVEVEERREGEEEDGRMGGEEKASALKRQFGCPYRGPSGALLVLVRCLSGNSYRPFQAPDGAVLWQRRALRTTMTGKNGDDSQRANRIIHACDPHCHFCYVWIQSVPT